MKKSTVKLSVVLLVLLVFFGALIYSSTVNAFQDFLQIAAPANPAAGISRPYYDSGTHKFACLNSDGSSCAPTGGGDTVATPYIGTGTNTLVGFIGGRPPTSGWSWANQNGAAETVTTNGARAVFQNAGGNLSIRYRSLAVTSNFTLILGMSCVRDNLSANNDLRCFVAVGDSGTKWAVWYYSTGYTDNGATGIDYWNSPTSFASTPINDAGRVANVLVYGPNIVFLKIVNAGGNLTWSWSHDNVGYIQFYTSSATAFLANNTYVGFGAQVNTNGTGGATSDLISYQETNP